MSKWDVSRESWRRTQELQLAHREVALLRRTLGWAPQGETPETARRREASPEPEQDERKMEDPLAESLEEDEVDPSEPDSATT